MHDDQLEITPGQVAALIADQLPQFRGLQMRTIGGGGTVNAIFRLGRGCRPSLPAAPPGPPIGPVLAGAGSSSGRGVPPGVAVSGTPAAASRRSGSRLPACRGWRRHGSREASPHPRRTRTRWRWPRIWSCSSHRLRACDTKGRTFGGQGRGGRLTDHATWVEECLQRSEDLVDTVALRQLWDRFRGLPREDADAMCHTDLIPGNLLTRAGRLTGVLDTGGFQPADPALDLVCGWHLLSSPARRSPPPRPRLQRSPVEARPGLGVRAGDRAGLVLPAHQRHVWRRWAVPPSNG